jgi:DNA-binding HxlR family transcriptional regulator
MPSRRRQDGVREKHVKLLGRMGRTRHSDGNSGLSTPASGEADRADLTGEAHRALDWRAVQAQLSPVRHRWDLAILCHLNDTVGCRPADLLAAINSEAENDRQLSPQVLSGRLRELERSGYVQHEDLSIMPLHRLYYLQPPGRALISDLLRISTPVQPTVSRQNMIDSHR